jgi:hypothetical protein
MARRRHGQGVNFLLGDARRLRAISELEQESFDGVVFLLSIQDMDPLDDVLASAAWAMQTGARIVLLLTHPCFRIPRQSGWGWDEGRKLVYRRVDRYLTPLPVPMKAYASGETRGVTRSFHRPLQSYVNGLSAYGLLVDRVSEIPGHRLPAAGTSTRAENLARREIPLFLGLRALKFGPATQSLE